MKGDSERARQLDQLASTVDMATAVGIQDAENDAVGAQLLGDGDVAAHDLDFVAGIAEVSAAGSNNDLHANGHTGADHFDQAGAGSDSSLEQITTQLDARRPTLLRGYCRRNRV